LRQGRESIVELTALSPENVEFRKNLTRFDAEMARLEQARSEL